MLTLVPPVQCCLISGTWPRCHPTNTPCSELSFPDALSAPVPHLPPETSTSTASSSSVEGNVILTKTSTRAVTTVTVTVEPASASLAAQKHVAPNEAQAGEPQNHIITHTTVEVVSQTITTVVAATVNPVTVQPTYPLSALPTYSRTWNFGHTSYDSATVTCWSTWFLHSYPGVPAHETVIPCDREPKMPPVFTGTVDEVSTTYFYDPGTFSSSATGASISTTGTGPASTENGTAASESVLGTPWDTVISASALSTTGLADTSAEGTEQTSQQSTVTSIATVDPTTSADTIITETSPSPSPTQSLNGEPSAIVSSLGDDENGAVAVAGGQCGWKCAGMGLLAVGMAAVM